jgi:hypothetical protein
MKIKGLLPARGWQEPLRQHGMAEGAAFGLARNAKSWAGGSVWPVHIRRLLCRPLLPRLHILRS